MRTRTSKLALALAATVVAAGPSASNVRASVTTADDKLFADWELEVLDPFGVQPDFSQIEVLGRDDGGLDPGAVLSRARACPLQGNTRPSDPTRQTRGGTP